MKTALIMEGGAMRGLFTCGVLDVFLENDVRFEAAAGISAGAVFGCNFKSRQHGRPLRYNKRYCRDPRYCSFRSLLKTGDLYGVDFCYRELPDVLDPFDRAAFRDNPMDFYIGATDVYSGDRVLYHKCTDGGQRDMDWMRASASMPAVSRPVSVDGQLLLDGGIVEAVPYRYMLGLGYDRDVLILTQPRGFRKKRTKAMPLMRLALHKYPRVAEAMAVRHERYNRDLEEIERDEAAGKIIVLRPPEALGISRTEKDPEELERVYRIGRQAALSRLEEIQRFLAPSLSPLDPSGRR